MTQSFYHLLTCICKPSIGWGDTGITNNEPCQVGRHRELPVAQYIAYRQQQPWVEHLRYGEQPKHIVVLALSHAQGEDQYPE